MKEQPEEQILKDCIKAASYKVGITNNANTRMVLEALIEKQIREERTMPEEINKIQFHGNFDEIEKFIGGDAEFRNGKLLVATREGPLWASTGDWIIKDADGKFRTVKGVEKA